MDAWRFESVLASRVVLCGGMEAGCALAQALAGPVTAVDPSVLVLGTSDAALSNLLVPLLQRHLYNELMGLQAGRADIMTVESVAAATLRGIAGLGINRAFECGTVPYASGIHRSSGSC